MYANRKSGRTVRAWSYSVVTERRYDIDLGLFRTYGIRLVTHGHEEVIHDVSSREEDVACITKLLNKHQLSPCHFRDVVEDML